MHFFSNDQLQRQIGKRRYVTLQQLLYSQLLLWVKLPTTAPHAFNAAACHIVTLLKSGDTWWWYKTLRTRSEWTVLSAALSPNETSVHYSLAS